MTVGFAFIALLVSSLGIYGVVAHGTAQRRREIGVRVALGSPLSGVVRLVVSQGLRPVALGLAVGVGGGLSSALFAQGLFFGFGALQWPALCCAVGVIGLAAGTACLLPALAAARLDPTTALRAE
jgi:putative ABC transport system permease protein